MKHLIIALGLIILMAGTASGYVSQDTQIPNNPINITGCTTPTVTELNLLTINFGRTDLDSDVGTYATNATEGSLDSATGVFTWTPSATDSGVYTWNFNVSDGFGSIDDCNVTITVEDYETVPDITDPYPDTPNTTQNYAADIDFGATIDQVAHNHWEIDTGSGYNNIEWDNSTTSPVWVFSPSTYDIGDYNIRLTTHNTSSINYNQSYIWAVHVGGNWTTHDMVLEPYFTHTVIAKDSLTYATISSFTATLHGVEKSTATGFITFENTSYGLYSLQVSASGHYASSSSILVTEDDTTTVYLESIVEADTDPGSGVYYPPHDVKFTVQSIWGTKYSGVDVLVYKGTNATAAFLAVTGIDGSVAFDMDETQQYRITFINSTAGISETRTLYPIDDHYYIIVSTTFDSWDTYDIPISDAIDFTISKNIINSTHAYINISYSDSETDTTDLKVYLNQTTESDYFNQTNLNTWNAGATSNGSHSFIVEDYTGQAYIIHLLAEHTTYGTIDSTYSISFKDDIAGKFPGIPESVWLYGSIFILLFTGGIFVHSNVEKGMLVVCIMFFIFFGLGTFATLPSNVQDSMLAGGILAFILSVIANLNKSNKDEGFS